MCAAVNRNFRYLVSEKGAPGYIGERTILQKTDTAGDWFIPSAVGSLTDPDGTFGNYQWTAQQVMDNLCEPYRAQYPDYITRTHLGKDQTGQYDMYGYVYAPEAYKATGLVKVSREGWAAILHEGVYCGNGRKGRYSFDTIEDADILWKNFKKRNRPFLSADFRPETLNYGILYDKIDRIKRNFAK